MYYGSVFTTRCDRKTRYRKQRIALPLVCHYIKQSGCVSLVYWNLSPGQRNFSHVRGVPVWKGKNIQMNIGVGAMGAVGVPPPRFEVFS